MAVTAAIAAFRESGATPGQVSALAFAERRAHFNLLWHYYKNTVFDDLALWQKYRQNYVLYKHIRSIYNPTKRLVNFYANQVYPGVLSSDALQLPDGVPIAIPLSRDTPEELQMAIAQFWQWSNWQSSNKLLLRFGAATGSVLAEILDDPVKGKVSAVVRWPGLVSEIELDDVGNLKFYALEYDTTDAEGKQYTYRKEVTRKSFRYFRDDSPFVPEGRLSAVEDHDYGFVPAVWCKHVDEGNDFGAPAIAGSVSKIDELNGLASHTDDLIDKVIENPGIIASSGRVGLIGADRTPTATDEYNAAENTRTRNSTSLILKGPADTTYVTMAPNLDPSEVLPHIESILGELERDFPELTMYQELRRMSQVTGPGAARMMGDVASRVLEVASNYDTQSIKLFQMATAIGGQRFREGREGWRMKTAQQRKFAPFDLMSYQKGELDFSIMPRPLIPMTATEALEIDGLRLDNAAKSEGLFSEDKRLEIAGIADPEERSQILAARRAFDVIPEGEQ